MTWQERSAEAATLAARAGEAEPGARLVALLLDPEDTAVSQAAAEALLARRDTAGLRLFVSAFGQAEEDTRNKLGDCLYDEPDLWSSVKQVLARLADDDNPAVRAGSRVLGAHMIEQERTHHR